MNCAAAFLVGVFLLLGIALPTDARPKQRVPIVEIRRVLPAEAMRDVSIRDLVYEALTNHLKDNFPGCTDLQASTMFTPGGSTALVRIRCFRIDRGLLVPRHYRGGIARLGFFFRCPNFLKSK